MSIDFAQSPADKSLMDVSNEQKLAQLDKVLKSRTLQGSESLKAFLRFVALKAIDNQDSYLKEYTIATEVFGRRSGYDSRSDSVVRVQAGRLRSKLQKYYDTEGKNDRVLIDLPKGHYTPVFSYIEVTNGAESINAEVINAAQAINAEGATNGAAASANSSSEVVPLEEVIGALESPAPAHSRARLIIACLVIASLALGTLAFKYGLEANRLRSSLASGTPETEEAQAAFPLWGDFLRSSEPILVAFSNTLFRGTAETGMKLLKPLDSSGANYNPPTISQSADQGEESVVTDHYTGIGEVMGIYFLGDLFYKGGRSFRVKRSLTLTWDDLKTENIVILGSPAENFLLRDLPQQQDFVFRIIKEDNQPATFGIINTRPAPDEQKIYLAKQEGPSRSQISEDYAVISLLRGLDEKHKLMILAGITTFGTQAAAEYATKPEHMKDLIAHLNTSPVGTPPRLPSFYQVLVKVKVNGGVPVQISYVTHHVL